VSTYRYVATSLLTGRVYADELPIIVNSAKRQISSAADLTGYLPLQADPAKNLPFIQAMTPRKSVLFVLQDGFPVWGGPIWDTPHQSMKSNQLPFRASTLESLFAKRIISAGLSFTDMDVFEIARQLIAYATSPAIGPNAAVANLSLGSNLAGYTDTLTFGVSNTLQTADGDTYYGTFSDEQDVLDALTTTAAADSFEFTFEPTVTGNGGFGWNLRLASALGQPGGGQVLTYPGAVIDYGRPTMGSAAANYLIGTSSANGSGSTYTSQYPHGIDTADLADGMPLLQAPVSWPGAGVTSQAQINGYAVAARARPGRLLVVRGQLAARPPGSGDRRAGAADPGPDQRVGPAAAGEGAGRADHAAARADERVHVDGSGRVTFARTPEERLAMFLEAAAKRLKRLEQRTTVLDAGVLVCNVVGTIPGSYTTGQATVVLQGQTAVIGPFPSLASYTPAAGQTVLLLAVGSSYVIAGPYA
jgi:hypothetical protein